MLVGFPLQIDNNVSFINSTAPSAPPSFFHVVVLNSTAIEFQWELPPLEFQNGIIRGYKLFYQEQGSMSESMVNVQDPDANVYIVAGLSPGTAYVCSMLAYTGADGPRTLYLTASTYANGTLLATTYTNLVLQLCLYLTDYTPFIIYFGINGNGLDRAMRNLNSEGDIAIHCATGTLNVVIGWYFSNGSQIGSTNRNLRQARSTNGTAILQIANGRSVDYCDAGVYTCRAVSTSGVVQERNFMLRVNSKYNYGCLSFPVRKRKFTSCHSLFLKFSSLILVKHVVQVVTHIN